MVIYLFIFGKTIMAKVVVRIFLLFSCLIGEYIQTLGYIHVGPGCSSVGYGATQEIGPFLADTNEKGLIFNPYAWNKGNLVL